VLITRRIIIVHTFPVRILREERVALLFICAQNDNNCGKNKTNRGKIRRESAGKCFVSYRIISREKHTGTATQALRAGDNSETNKAVSARSRSQ